MSTAATPPAAAGSHAEQDLVIYSHSPLFYWWPVWAVGFIMALLTLADGGRMAIVPDGTKADRALHVEAAANKIETREGLLVPKDHHLYPDHPKDNLPEPEQ